MEGGPPPEENGYGNHAPVVDSVSLVVPQGVRGSPISTKKTTSPATSSSSSSIVTTSPSMEAHKKGEGKKKKKAKFQQILADTADCEVVSGALEEQRREQMTSSSLATVHQDTSDGGKLRKTKSAHAIGRAGQQQGGAIKKEHKGKRGKKKEAAKREKDTKGRGNGGGDAATEEAKDSTVAAGEDVEKKKKKEKEEQETQHKYEKAKSPRVRGRTAASLLFTYPRRDKEREDNKEKEEKKEEKKTNSESFSLRLALPSKQRRKTSGGDTSAPFSASLDRFAPADASSSSSLASSILISSTNSLRTKNVVETKRAKDDSVVALRSHHSHSQSDLSSTPVLSDVAADDGDSSSSDLEDTFDDDRGKDITEMNITLPPSLSDLSRAERTNVKVIHLLYNPRSGNKTGEKVMRNARKLLERNGKAVEVTRLQYKGHAEVLCETMDLDGIDVLCSVGGDGTFHECVNGIMKRLVTTPDARVPPMALIAAGTGNSFMHEIGAAKMTTAIKHICRGVHIPIDICKLTFGDSTSCYSFNSMHWGMASKVAVTAEKLRWMGTAIRYTTAALIEMMKGKTARARITITDDSDNIVTYDEDFALAIANNIITAGKGMKMAPTAKLDDGLIDLLLITTASTLDMMTIFRKVYDGSHTKLPHVRYIKVKSFSIMPYRQKEEKRDREKLPRSSSKGAISGEREASVGSAKDDIKRKADKEKKSEVLTVEKLVEMAVGEKELSEESASILASITEQAGEAAGDIEEIEELLDVDGELKGCTPFTCDVLPCALRVIL